MSARVRRTRLGWIAGLIVALAIVVLLDRTAAARPYSGAIGATVGTIILLILNRRSV